MLLYPKFRRVIKNRLQIDFTNFDQLIQFQPKFLQLLHQIQF